VGFHDCAVDPYYKEGGTIVPQRVMLSAETRNGRKVREGKEAKNGNRSMCVLQRCRGQKVAVGTGQAGEGGLRAAL